MSATLSRFDPAFLQPVNDPLADLASERQRRKADKFLADFDRLLNAAMERDKPVAPLPIAPLRRPRVRSRSDRRLSDRVLVQVARRVSEEELIFVLLSTSSGRPTSQPAASARDYRLSISSRRMA